LSICWQKNWLSQLLIPISGIGSNAKTRPRRDSERLGCSQQQPEPDPAKTISISKKRSLQKFLCHASGDKPSVRALYNRLFADGFAPSLDEKNLAAGTRWASEIKKAVRVSDVVLICTSKSLAHQYNNALYAARHAEDT
jgi:hypothetical protein